MKAVSPKDMLPVIRWNVDTTKPRFWPIEKAFFFSFFFWQSTFGKTDVAKHYLVGMIKGVKSHWKQVVAHELTEASTSGSDMKQFVYNIISAAHSIEWHVRASVSDMGSSNKAM